MLCGSLKSNGLADPFKNNEEDTFPEEQLPPPLQEHGSAVDQPLRKGRQSERAPAPEGLVHAVHPAGYQPQDMPQVQQPASSQQLHFPSYFDMWPAHAAAMSQALGANMRFGANGIETGGMRHLNQDSDAAARASSAAAAFGVNPSAYQAAGLLPSQAISNGYAATAGATTDAVTNSSLPSDSSPELDKPKAPATVVPAVLASQEAPPASEAPQPPGLPASSVAPQASTAVAASGAMHRPVQSPTPPGSLPPLRHPSLPHAAVPASTAATLSSSFPGSFLFLPNAPAADSFAPALHSSTAADVTRLAQSQLGWYAQHLPPFTGPANPAGLNGYLPSPFVLDTHQVPLKAESPAAVDADGLSSAAAGLAVEAGRKRKSPGSSQKKGPRTGGASGDTGGPVIARRAANRPPPQVKLQLTKSL